MARGLHDAHRYARAQETALREDADGTIRIGQTRVTLDTVIGYWEGMSAEEIASAYSSLDLADVHAVLGYYLSNCAAVDQHCQSTGHRLIWFDTKSNGARRGSNCASDVGQTQQHCDQFIMLSFLADENFNGHIVRGLLRRLPTLDLVRIQDVGLSGAEDAEVLEWASRENRAC